MPNGKCYSYTDLALAWRCCGCGGHIEHRVTSDLAGTLTDWAECGRCGGREFECNGIIRKEQVDAVLVIEGLPMELQEAVRKARPKLLSEDDIKASAELLY